jgi:hypothetical protein
MVNFSSFKNPTMEVITPDFYSLLKPRITIAVSPLSKAGI